MKDLTLKQWLRLKWRDVRSFDYSNLSFLYVACLVTIAFVYTLFRVGEYAINQQQSRALWVIQQIDSQRDLAAELERLIALAQNPTILDSESALHRLVGSYGQLVQDQDHVFEMADTLQVACAHRVCANLFKRDFFTITAQEFEKGMVGRGSSSPVRTALLQKMFDATVRYHLALKDTLIVALEIIRAKNQAIMNFDILAYVALMIVLLVQALYVFRPAIRHLKASLATRSEFLSRISHEIRNPMNSIIGMADILKDTRLNFEQQQYVDNLLRSGHSLLSMLNNLIDFSVLETKRMKLIPVSLNLFETLERCVHSIDTLAQHKNLSLYLHLDPQVPNQLRGDAVRLEQVLMNLLNNAVKFTAQGSLTLAVELEKQDARAAWLNFCVSDTGIGIEATKVDEIFESFVQVDSSIQRKYGGPGLGLSIAREIVRLMGGRLEVASVFGEGSQFSFTVKLRKQRHQADTSEAPLTRLSAIKFAMLVAPEEVLRYQGGLARLNSFHLLQSVPELRERILTNGPENLDEILIDDSIGIIAMINCRNLAEELGCGEKTVALIRSTFNRENMDLLKRNGYTRLLRKPLRPWDLLELPAKSFEQPTQSRPASPTRLLGKLKEKNLKVLLVDDSNDNLFLLKEVVAPLASTIHFAENGLDAIEKFKGNAYDVVFMDIQMPVMDGYTAIRKMREAEVEAGHRRPIPIYAVTAHAGLVDAQKCREAGFTARIVKPVDRDDIYKSLSQAFSVDVASLDLIDAEDPVEDVADGPEGVLPTKYLAKLMPTYFKTRFEDLERLRGALNKSDFEALRGLGHKIKGSTASYGFIKASHLSLQLENSARAEDLVECRRIVDQLEVMFQTARKKFNA